jgi:hypothetical protein
MSWGALQSESLEGDEVGAGSGDRGGSVYERSDQMRASPSGLVSDSLLGKRPIPRPGIYKEPVGTIKLTLNLPLDYHLPPHIYPLALSHRIHVSISLCPTPPTVVRSPRTLAIALADCYITRRHPPTPPVSPLWSFILAFLTLPTYSPAHHEQHLRYTVPFSRIRLSTPPLSLRHVWCGQWHQSHA